MPAIDGQDVVIIGNGNVALDCARILAKGPEEFAGSDIVGHALERLTTSRARSITIVGRRGPHQIAMTPKELGELGHLARARPIVDPADLPPVESDQALEPGQRKSVNLLREFAASPGGDGLPVRFDFFAAPVRIEGQGRAERLVIERTQLGADGAAVGTGETYELPAGLVISCIGYRTPPIADVPYDEKLGRFANMEGRISPGLYCVGWARRGPTGTIGTNKPDGFTIAEQIAQDQPEPAGKQGRAGLDTLIAERNLDIVTFRDWQKIDLAEIERARAGAPREKFVRVEDMVAASRS
jgi:ferredoxin--NADP+ reductase